MSTASSVSSSSSTSFGIPECGIVSTPQEKHALLQASYTTARSEIIQGLTHHLRAKAPDLWICSRHLFNGQTLPSSISVPKFGMEIWKSTTGGGDSMVVGDSTVFLGGGDKDEDNAVLLRHKFDNGYYYYRACALTLPLSQDEELLKDLQDLVDSAVRDFATTKNSQEEEKASKVLSNEMKTLIPSALADVLAAKELKVGIVPKTFTISWKKQLCTYIQC